jgi:hypothetical protein
VSGRGRRPLSGQGPLLLTWVAERDADGRALIFKTARPVTFTTLKNTEKSPQLGSLYGQDIEPTGTYLLHDTEPAAGPLARGWVRGAMQFRMPIVLRFTPNEAIAYGENDWKHRLVQETRAKGRALSRYLLGLGYDGIVTVARQGGVRGTQEIVALRA